MRNVYFGIYNYYTGQQLTVSTSRVNGKQQRVIGSAGGEQKRVSASAGGVNGKQQRVSASTGGDNRKQQRVSASAGRVNGKQQSASAAECNRKKQTVRAIGVNEKLHRVSASAGVHGKQQEKIVVMKKNSTGSNEKQPAVGIHENVKKRVQENQAGTLLL